MGRLPIEDIKLIAWYELLNNESITTYDAMYRKDNSTIGMRKFNRFGKCIGVAGYVPYTTLV